MFSRKKTPTLIVLPCAAMFGLNALAADPYNKPDDSWINISGTVEAVTQDAFTLDYGEGIVTVEMDDGDRDADAYKLLKGDKVSVSGLVDADLFETTTIEASSVYVESIGTHFFASAVDEEDYATVAVTTPVVVSNTVLRGLVTEVGPTSFKINTGDKQMEVDVDEMPYNPLDDEGYQKIEKGDFVEVSGYIDDELFDGRVFDARALTVLVNS